MKTLREMMDLIESAQPDDVRARAAELAIAILKNADLDDDSEQGYIRVDPNALFQFYMLMKTAKQPGVTEGIMDVVKQTFNDNVAGWPMGTSAEQFIQGWARDIRDRTGKTIPVEKLKQLYNDYTSRSPELMQSHGTTNEEQELDETELDPVRRIEELFRDKR